MIGRTNVGIGNIHTPTIIGFIHATYPAGSTCTCSKGSTTLTAEDTSGYYIFNVAETGIWTISSTDGSQVSTQTVTVEIGSVYYVSLSYRVPVEYQAVEYIQSTGQQAIDTGVSGSSWLKVELDIIPNYNSNGYAYMFGAGRASNNDYSFRIGDAGSANSLVFQAGYTGSKDSIPSSGSWAGYGNRHTIIADGLNGSATIDNSLAISFTPASSNQDLYANVYLFAIAYTRNNSVSSYMYATLYSAKIYNENGELIRDFEPCYRKADSVAGLWDVVNKVFYTNVGSGAFIVGADK